MSTNKSKSGVKFSTGQSPPPPASFPLKKILDMPLSGFDTRSKKLKGKKPDAVAKGGGKKKKKRVKELNIVYLAKIRKRRLDAVGRRRKVAGYAASSETFVVTAS